MKIEVILSASLIRLASMPARLPAGRIFFRLKNSVSTRSKEFGCVTTRLVTSSVTTGMYSMVMPRSSFTFLAISADWFTAVPR